MGTDDSFIINILPDGNLGTGERQVEVIYDEECSGTYEYNITLREATAAERKQAKLPAGEHGVSIDCGERFPVVVGYKGEEGNVEIRFTTHGPRVCFNVMAGGKHVQKQMRALIYS
jgi:hypothetical protein